MARERGQYVGLGIALLRVALGIYYLMHAYLAYWVIGVERFTQVNETSYGLMFPGAVAWFVVLGHLIGGLLLLLGVYARIGALINAIIMAGAVYTVHLKQGFFLHGIITDANAGRAISGGYEYTLFLLLATIVIILTGGRPFSRLSLRFGKSPSISLD